MSKEIELQNEILKPSPIPQSAKTTIPITTRLAIEIPKPKDWQAFQRNCVLLFRAELNDPHAQEYGRTGQNQRGIDILSRRDGRDNHFVGVQCRLIVAPLKEKKILSDARKALKIKAGLKELIFATTAPDDTAASDAAISVSRTLKEEGHDLTIVVYGWGQLQTLIAPHETAYNAFHPSAVASSTPQVAGPVGGASDFATLVAARLIEEMRGMGMAAVPKEDVSGANEDPALHARIDTFRDLFKDQSQPLIAEKGLLAILEKEDLSTKPRALYRVETNLGFIAMDLGREAEAADRFEAAHSACPSEPNALANVALAKMIRGHFEEAMTVAQAALAGEPRANNAIGYLLQAAARCDWQGDPETLIPDDLLGSGEADIGLAEFLRHRGVPGWAERSLEIVRRHSELPEFKLVRAIAVLSLAIESGEIVSGGYGSVTCAELNTAANDMKALVDHYLDVGFAAPHDLMAHLNNAAVLLRLCGRHAESETILMRGMPRINEHPQLRRLLALAQSAQDRDEDAIASLEGDSDPENQLLRAEFQASSGDVAGALASVIAIEAYDLPDRLQWLRWRTMGESALWLGDRASVNHAVAGLRTLNPNDIAASLLEIRIERKTLADEEIAQERLRALTVSVPSDLDLASRSLLAFELQKHGLPEEASYLLEGHVDLSRPSRLTSLFLQSLAAARRDAAFQVALNEAAQEVRSHPETLWTVAAHAWNLGNLAASLSAIDALLAQDPDEPRARLLKIEILVRTDRSLALFAELEKPLEKLVWRNVKDQFRLASLLANFGFNERAADLAYHLFLQNRDNSQAWMTLSLLVLDEGRGDEDTPRLWDAASVGVDAAVDLTYDDGTETFFIVEPDLALRRLDPASWEPEHPLIRALMGVRAGERFVGSDGREGVVRQVRHKYVARLHYVIENHEARFPEISGFKRVSTDVGQPGGLDNLIALIKARHDWVQDEESQYTHGHMPLGVLAFRTGMDTIDVAGGLASHGSKLKVAAGGLDEREAGVRSVRANELRGCVLDLLAFWTAWRLGALETIHATCGQIHLPQSVLDRLRARRKQFDSSARDGHKSAGYEAGKIIFHEVSAETMADQRDETDRAIAWVEKNAHVLPVVASDELSGELRKFLRLGRSDVFDSLIIARQSGMLLITDDLPTREIERVFGGNGSAWLQMVFNLALNDKHIELEQYIRWSAYLIEAGHNYLGVSGVMLVQAAHLDAASGDAPGYLFRTLSQMIGGKVADPVSHTYATIDFLHVLWNDPKAFHFRQPVTGYLLRQLIRNRINDYGIILKTVVVRSRRLLGFTEYMRIWLRGHFIPKTIIDIKDDR